RDRDDLLRRLHLARLVRRLSIGRPTSGLELHARLSRLPKLLRSRHDLVTFGVRHALDLERQDLWRVLGGGDDRSNRLSARLRRQLRLLVERSRRTEILVRPAVQEPGSLFRDPAWIAAAIAPALIGEDRVIAITAHVERERREEPAIP